MHREVSDDLSKKYGVPVCDFHGRAKIDDAHWVNAKGEPDINHLDLVGERQKAELIGGDVPDGISFGNDFSHDASG